MYTSHSRFVLAGVPVQRIDFEPSSFAPGDLHILPHAAQLENAVVKRQSEHLAGRIAARLALLEAGADDKMPGIGMHREPLWPAGFTGSISHCAQTALAVVVPQSPILQGIGLDCESVLLETTAQNIAGEIVDRAECALLQNSGMPFNLAVTLAFSAKESLFKAMFPQVKSWFGFDAARITTLTRQQLILELTRAIGPFHAGQRFTADAQVDDQSVITLIRYP